MTSPATMRAPAADSGAAVSSVSAGGNLPDPTALILAGLERAAAELRGQGVPVPPMEGKVLRPLVAYALVPPGLRDGLDGRFWAGALAVQMVHEASLLHDDILDHASERRGRETLVSRSGVGPALVLGDHYLTGAYRAAAAAGAPSFLDCFIRAVERTVAGEVAQERSAGRALSRDEYIEIVTGKSGELFGAATCLGGALFGLPSHADRVALGCELGALYQQVDDLLDYCPAASTGKPPLQDYRQRKWTWILELSGLGGFGEADAVVLRRIFHGVGGQPSPARRALAELGERSAALLERVARLAPGDRVVAAVLAGWLAAATEGVEAQEAALGASPRRRARHSPHEAHVADLARSLGGPEAWPAYFGRHARTFRFAARLFPPEPARLISGVYAYCRFTDDLVDGPADGARPPVVQARLESWAELSRSAFEGHATGIPLLDVVLGEAGGRGVSWRYPDALLAGVAMDLTRFRYPDWSALEEYTFGVAGSVGGWITQLFGISDEALLARAHALGHGMQLTNIARDVGEDLERGRLYIPLEALAEHGLDREALEALQGRGGPHREAGSLPPAYRALVESILRRADDYYEEAWPGIRALPAWYRRPVAVAAEAYRGIHARIRANGYDNLTLRAHTSPWTKAVLGAKGLIRSHG